MHLQKRTTSIIAWFLCAAGCLVAVSTFVILLIQNGQSENALKLVGDATWSLLPIFFAITAALIVSRQPGNVIGWLLMVPAFLAIIAVPINLYMNGVKTPPAHLSFQFLLLVWFSSWSWLLLIFPLILIPFLFPTGRPPSARWRWVLFLVAGLCIIFVFIATFADRLDSTNGDWSVPNPIGFLNSAAVQTLIVPWQIGLIATVILCAASLFMRYRRAGSVERKQIKWLLYSIGIFTLIYIPGFGINSSTNSIVADLFNLLFNLALLTLPASIAIAILNYRLWDIDILIHRTLTYAALTATLAFFYFGSILALQQAFHFISGNSSPIAIVISTLAIAALFAPVRKRVQEFIDRRFYRQKYDAACALEEFQAVTSRMVEIERLTGQLVDVVEQTVHPDGVWIWIRK